jgi:hypothetical protein
MRKRAIWVAPASDLIAETIKVGQSPSCDHLGHLDEYVLAHCAGFTNFETHAFMCTSCFNLYGMGLGPGKGQKLVIGA